MLSKKNFAFKLNFYCWKVFFDYNFIILKEIVIIAGISNHTIVDFIEKKTSNDVKRNFAGVSPSSYVTRFITFHSMMTEMGVYNYEYRSKW